MIKNKQKSTVNSGVPRYVSWICQSSCLNIVHVLVFVVAFQGQLQQDVVARREHVDHGLGCRVLIGSGTIIPGCFIIYDTRFLISAAGTRAKGLEDRSKL
jgi:hypothetical protein